MFPDRLLDAAALADFQVSLERAASVLNEQLHAEIS